MRLISWAWVFHRLSGHPDRPQVFVSRAFLKSLYHHRCFLVDFEARTPQAPGSGLGHHLIGESAGRYIAALTWPVFAESAVWQREAKAVLEREIDAQVMESGIHRQMSFGHQLFSTEAFLLPAILGEQRGDDFSRAYLERLGAQVKALAWLRDASGSLPRYGDGDEGMTVRLHGRSEPRADWIINAGRRFLDVPVAEAPHGSLVGTLLLGQPAPGTPRPQAVRVPSSFGFPDAGLFPARHAERGAGAGERGIARASLERRARGRAVVHAVRGWTSRDHRSGNLHVPRPVRVTRVLQIHARAQHHRTRRAGSIRAARRVRVGVARERHTRALGTEIRRRRADGLSRRLCQVAQQADPSARTRAARQAPEPHGSPGGFRHARDRPEPSPAPGLRGHRRGPRSLARPLFGRRGAGALRFPADGERAPWRERPRALRLVFIGF